MAGNHDNLITQLEAERAAILARAEAIEAAIEALTGTRPGGEYTGGSRRRSSVGDDKLEAVKQYIFDRGKVRQADIAKDLDLNSGTVSTATHELMLAGEIEQLPKVDRSYVWKAVAH